MIVLMCTGSRDGSTADAPGGTCQQPCLSSAPISSTNQPDPSSNATSPDHHPHPHSCPDPCPLLPSHHSCGHFCHSAISPSAVQSSGCQGRSPSGLCCSAAEAAGGLCKLRTAWQRPHCSQAVPSSSWHAGTPLCSCACLPPNGWRLNVIAQWLPGKFDCLCVTVTMSGSLFLFVIMSVCPFSAPDSHYAYMCILSLLPAVQVLVPLIMPVCLFVLAADPLSAQAMCHLTQSWAALRQALSTPSSPRPPNSTPFPHTPNPIPTPTSTPIVHIMLHMHRNLAQSPATSRKKPSGAPAQHYSCPPCQQTNAKLTWYWARLS